MGSEMCIRDRIKDVLAEHAYHWGDEGLGRRTQILLDDGRVYFAGFNIFNFMGGSYPEDDEVPVFTEAPLYR